MLKFVEPPQTPGCPILRAFGEGWDVQIQCLIHPGQKIRSGGTRSTGQKRSDPRRASWIERQSKPKRRSNWFHCVCSCLYFSFAFSAQKSHVKPKDHL